jgi:hypothetical protein
MMLMRSFTLLLALGAPMMIAGCVAPSSPPPPVPTRPMARPAAAVPAKMSAKLPGAMAWTDRALTPGTWVYRQDDRGGLAVYGLPGANAALMIRCDRAAARIFISRPGTVAGRMTLRATTGLFSYAALPTAGGVPYVAAALVPADRQLDALAFSRGRFLISLDGQPDLVVPSWPEVARVIEDCRG